MSRDANASRLRLAFLSTLLSCSSCFVRAKKNNNNRQKFIVIVKTNMKASEIIDCTCTLASISSISRFACANVWSVRVVTKSIYVTFVGICFAFVNIWQKKKRKEKREKNEKWDLCFIQKSYMYMYEKKWNTRLQFFVSCDSRVGPTVQTAIFQFFSLVWQRLSKAYAINCSCFPTGAHVIYTKKERTN